MKLQLKKMGRIFTLSYFRFHQIFTVKAKLFGKNLNDDRLSVAFIIFTQLIIIHASMSLLNIEIFDSYAVTPAVTIFLIISNILFISKHDFANLLEKANLTEYFYAKLLAGLYIFIFPIIFYYSVNIIKL